MHDERLHTLVRYITILYFIYMSNLTFNKQMLLLFLLAVALI